MFHSLHTEVLKKRWSEIWTLCLCAYVCHVHFLMRSIWQSKILRWYRRWTEYLRFHLPVKEYVLTSLFGAILSCHLGYHYCWTAPYQLLESRFHLDRIAARTGKWTETKPTKWSMIKLWFGCFIHGHETTPLLRNQRQQLYVRKETLSTN